MTKSKPKSKPKPKAKSKLKFPDRKISDTLLQFAEPLLDSLGPNATEAQMEQSLKIAWTVWNSVVYADVTGNSGMLNKLRHTMGANPLVNLFVESLIQRKRALFSDDERMIGEYELFYKNGEQRLRAAAVDPRCVSL